MKQYCCYDSRDHIHNKTLEVIRNCFALWLVVVFFVVNASAGPKAKYLQIMLWCVLYGYEGMHHINTDVSGYIKIQKY